MSLVYRGNGAWGTGKGSPLTSTEGDNNIWELDQRIVALEAAPSAPYIDNVVQDGNSIIFELTNDTQVGPVTLPQSQWEWTGDWTTATTYVKNDVVVDPDTLIVYLVLRGHTSTGSVMDPDLLVSGQPAFALMVDPTAGGGGGGGGYSAVDFISNVAVANSYTLVNADHGKLYYIDDDVTVHVPDSGTPIDNGFNVHFMSLNGTLTIDPDGAAWVESVPGKTLVMGGDNFDKYGSVVSVHKVWTDDFAAYGTGWDDQYPSKGNLVFTPGGAVTLLAAAHKDGSFFNVYVATSITIPADSSQNFPIGTELTFNSWHLDGTDLTFVADTGVTFMKKTGSVPKSNVYGAIVKFKKTAANQWAIWGDYV